MMALPLTAAAAAAAAVASSRVALFRVPAAWAASAPPRRSSRAADALPLL